MKRAFVFTGLFALLFSSCGAKNTCDFSKFVRDRDGRTLILHGVNVIDSSSNIASQNSSDITTHVLTRDDFAFIQSLGFNFIRLTRFWHELEPEKGQINQSYIERTRELLDWAYEAGMLVVIDMHQDIYAPMFGGRGMPDWTVRAGDQPFTRLEPWWLNYINPAVMMSYDHLYSDEDLVNAYINAVMIFVNEFHNHPAVIGYDLMNEPFSGTHNIFTFEKKVLQPFFEKIIKAIRKVDKKNYIFYEPLSFTINSGLFSSSLEHVYDPEEKTVYFPHFYQLNIHEGIPYRGDMWYFNQWEKYRLMELERQKPLTLMLGEFGAFPSQENVLYIERILDMMDRIGTGWAYWDYGPGRGFSLIDESRSPGIFVDVLKRTYARKIPGDLISQGYDASTGTFTLEFRACETANDEIEFFINEDAYPAGFTIYMDGGELKNFTLNQDVLTFHISPDGQKHTVLITSR